MNFLWNENWVSVQKNRKSLCHKNGLPLIYPEKIFIGSDNNLLDSSTDNNDKYSKNNGIKSGSSDEIKFKLLAK